MGFLYKVGFWLLSLGFLGNGLTILFFNGEIKDTAGPVYMAAGAVLLLMPFAFDYLGHFLFLV